MDSLKLTIHGMSCGHCVMRVSKTLTALDGVVVDQVSIGAVSLRFDPARIDGARIAAALSEAGYEARPAQ
jgi:copper chaperone CopZ